MSLNRDLPNPICELRGLTKRFGGFVALEDVSLTLRPGEIHALMGENGAGKSTLIRLASGLLTPDGGEIRYAGKPVHFGSSSDARRAGISTVFQEINLLPNLTVSENLMIGREPRTRLGINWKETREQAGLLLDRLGLKLDLDQTLSSYSVAHQQLVACARALSGSPGVLILDEPTSSLDREETVRLFSVLRSLRDEGVSILFVTHFLEQVYELCDRITVLRSGKFVAEGTVQEMPRGSLVAHMIGRSEASLPTAKGEFNRGAEVLLTAKAVTQRKKVEGLSASVVKGSVLGFAGLLGSGRTESLQLLFGCEKADSGTIEVRGTRVRRWNPVKAVRAGFGYCPEDRKINGVALDFSVRENIVLVIQSRRPWWNPLRKDMQEKLVNQMVSELKIALSDIEQPVRELSGGNQQKVSLSKWLVADVDLLMLDEPTRGIDIGAKEDVLNKIGKLRDDGMAIVFVSSELGEVVRISDTVSVMRDHQMVNRVEGEAITESNLMQLISEGGS